MNELMNLEEAKNINGYLQKKSPSIFGGWQSRYFSITDGRFLIYSDEKGAKAKGVIDLDKAKITSDLDPKIFKISISDREFILKAESEEEKISWVNSLKCLSVIKRKMTMKSKTEKEVLEDDEIPVRVHSKTQNWKIKNIDKDAFSVILKF